MRSTYSIVTLLKLLHNTQADPSLPNSQNQATVEVPGHYWLWNQDGHIMDLAKSAKGCLYEDLPTDYTINTDQGGVNVPLNGQWNCTTKDISDKGRNYDVKDMCNLVCDTGFGLNLKHLQDQVTGDPNTERWKMKSKRLVCKKDKNTQKMTWQPASQETIYPRCINSCGELQINNNNQDSKAQLICRNLGAIHEDYCTPGINCYHGATCYATCEYGFETNEPKESNEMLCKCTQKKCGWDIPDDIGNLGQCKFVMYSNNKRIIGGEDGGDTEESKYQITYGTTTNNGRKKRSPGENLIDHRRAKRGAQNGIRWQHICGGVVLTAQWAFTAAHCRTVGLRCILGEVDFTIRTGSEVPCRVKVQLRHPQYNGQTYHDIMMTNMQCKKLRMGVFIWPAKLPRPDALVPVGNDCTVCGWGTMSYPHFSAATTLQCIDLPIMERDTCNIPYNGAIHNNIICMGELGVSGQDSCQGDSGSGAFCNGICYGLVMGGLYCADESYPGVYTILSKYVPWAVEVIKAFITRNAGRGGGRRGRKRRALTLPAYTRNLHLPENQLKHQYRH